MQSIDNVIKEIILNYNNDIKQVLKKSRQKQIVIFGAGQLGHKVYRILGQQGINVKCFCDNKTGGQSDVQTGIRIARIEELKTERNNIFLLIAVFDDRAYNTVYRQLLECGFEEEQLMNAKSFTEKLPISYLEQNKEKYKRAYSLLDDEDSKEIYLTMMRKAYLDDDISKIVDREEEQYFDKKIIFSEEEVFVDCGGFDGETAARFVNRVNGRFKKIIIFEPEESKRNVIEKNLGNHEFILYNYGLWSKDTVLKFDARGDSASAVYEYGDSEIIVKTLDGTVFPDEPTFIKMDIEGSETEALKGCKKIIEAYKPKLAICIYHKPEDLFEIPIMLKEMCPDYKLSVRQYADSRFETVCYAV